MSEQQRFIDRIAAAFADETAVSALFLGGSHGRGTADEFSDLDFVALAESARHEEVARLWRQAVEAIGPVVFWNERAGSTILLNAITDDWLRVDLWVIDPAAFLDLANASSAAYARSTLKTVIDRDGLFERLPDKAGQHRDRREVEYLINEFIRVLGLISVGLGRGELVLGVMGAGLLRDLLIRLMVQETLSPDRGGMLHLSRTITTDQMAELLRLPYPSPDGAMILDAHWALAKAFFPRAKRLARKLGIEWPSAFEEATRAHLRRSFGSQVESW